MSDELASSTRKGANNVLNGYTSTTDDVPIVSGTLNGVSYSAYVTNDSVDGTSNAPDRNVKVMNTTVAAGPGSSKAIVQTIVGCIRFRPVLRWFTPPMM